MLSDIFHFIEFMLLFAVGLIALFFVLLHVASKMPADSPVRLVVMSLSHRIAATAGLMIVDPIATSIPVAGQAIDIVTLIGLAWYWFGFFKKAATVMRSRPAAQRPRD